MCSLLDKLVKLTLGTFAGLVKTLLTEVLKVHFYSSSDGIDGIMRRVNEVGLRVTSLKV